jgi:aspartyl-tRNA(Asn)/glutamyl-tRNA(Gln) amidotransferase subunit B
LTNWIINEGIIAVTEEKAIELLGLVEKGEISGKIAKDVLAKMIDSKKSAKEVMEEYSYSHIKDEAEIEKIVDKVLAENPKSIEDYHAGKIAALKFLVGAVMKETKGQADPQITNKIIENKLGEK